MVRFVLVALLSVVLSVVSATAETINTFGYNGFQIPAFEFGMGFAQINVPCIDGCDGCEDYTGSNEIHTDCDSKDTNVGLDMYFNTFGFTVCGSVDISSYEMSGYRAMFGYEVPVVNMLYNGDYTHITLTPLIGFQINSYSASVTDSRTYVNSYTKQDGTYVHGYYRSNGSSSTSASYRGSELTYGGKLTIKGSHISAYLTVSNTGACAGLGFYIPYNY